MEILRRAVQDEAAASSPDEPEVRTTNPSADELHRSCRLLLTAVPLDASWRGQALFPRAIYAPLSGGVEVVGEGVQRASGFRAQIRWTRYKGSGGEGHYTTLLREKAQQGMSIALEKSLLSALSRSWL
jgi:hypothetical protein